MATNGNLDGCRCATFQRVLKCNAPIETCPARINAGAVWQLGAADWRTRTHNCTALRKFGKFLWRHYSTSGSKVIFRLFLFPLFFCLHSPLLHSISSLQVLRFLSRQLSHTPHILHRSVPFSGHRANTQFEAVCMIQQLAPR